MVATKDPGPVGMGAHGRGPDFLVTCSGLELSRELRSPKGDLARPRDRRPDGRGIAPGRHDQTPLFL